LPAIWQPDPYQDWTSLAPHCVWCSASVTSGQTVIYQDTPRGVGQILQDDLKLWFLSCNSLTMLTILDPNDPTGKNK
jgi:hypothetical protein